MKRTIFFLMLFGSIFVAAKASADCMSGSIRAYPASTATLPANASVIVTLFGTEREVFKKERQKQLFFKSGKHKVEAKLVWERNSKFGLKALYFKASKNLKVGKTYTFDIGGKKFMWEIGKVDTTKPKWVKGPTQTGFSKVEFGCGPATNYFLGAKVSDASEVFYDVVLKAKDGKIQHFFVTASEGKIRIGHRMCSGAFVPPKENDVQVEITPYDFAGNKGRTKSLILKR